MFFRSKKGAPPPPPAASGQDGRPPLEATGGPPPLPDQPPPLPPQQPETGPAPYEFPDQALSEIEAQPWPSVQVSQPEIGPEKQLQAALGQIVALLTRTPGLQDLSIATVRTVVMPALSTGQFLLAEGRNRKTGRAGPLAAVLWARVSPQIDDAITRDRGQLMRMAEPDWKSGDIVWITLAVGDQNLTRQMIERLRTTSFKGQPVKLFATGSDTPVTLEAR